MTFSNLESPRNLSLVCLSCLWAKIYTETATVLNKLLVCSLIKEKTILYEFYQVKKVKAEEEKMIGGRLKKRESEVGPST